MLFEAWLNLVTLWQSQGPWSPSKIANPDYFLDEKPLANVGKVGGVAIEVWTMDDNYYFSNILVDQDPSVAEKARDQYWQPKQALEVLTKHSSSSRCFSLPRSDPASFV